MKGVRKDRNGFKNFQWKHFTNIGSNSLPVLIFTLTGETQRQLVLRQQEQLVPKGEEFVTKKKKMYPYLRYPIKFLLKWFII